MLLVSPATSRYETVLLFSTLTPSAVQVAHPGRSHQNLAGPRKFRQRLRPLTYGARPPLRRQPGLPGNGEHSLPSLLLAQPLPHFRVTIEIKTRALPSTTQSWHGVSDGFCLPKYLFTSTSPSREEITLKRSTEKQNGGPPRLFGAFASTRPRSKKLGGEVDREKTD